MQLKIGLRVLGLCVLSVAFMSWTIDELTLVDNHKSITNTAVTHVAKKANGAFAALEIVYDSLELDRKGLSYDAFEYAIKGFKKLEEEGALQNDSILTIIDFDQPSSNKRMYILDVKNQKMLFNTLVAHGKNTGTEIAESFSNNNESHKSSLGFYVTDRTYVGSNGYSLKLRGQEPGVNDNALRRAIVIHGATYVSESLINAQGYIGRSYGCPAIPTALTRPIIQTIKDGSCLFIYNKSYKPSSQFKLG